MPYKESEKEKEKVLVETVSDDDIDTDAFLLQIQQALPKFRKSLRRRARRPILQIRNMESSAISLESAIRWARKESLSMEVWLLISHKTQWAVFAPDFGDKRFLI